MIDLSYNCCPDVYNYSLAEYALTACNWFAKRLESLRMSQKRSEWSPLVVDELRGSTFGVIGYGNIGRRCAELAKAYKMKVLALKRNPQDAQQDVDSGLLVRRYQNALYQCIYSSYHLKNLYLKNLIKDKLKVPKRWIFFHCIKSVIV